MEKYARKISSPPFEQGTAFTIPVTINEACSTKK